MNSTISKWMSSSASRRSPLKTLYMAQFLSAFADNVIFFAILGIAKRSGIGNPEAYMTTVQTAFLLAYVVLAPYVGAVADKNTKSRILLIGNLIKAAGIAFILLDVHPAVCYAIVGIGAVVYSPAKYGILPELAKSEQELLLANGKLESYTIMAIITGTLAGGYLADIGHSAGIVVCVILYFVSLGASLLIPSAPGRPGIRYGRSFQQFFTDMGTLFANRRTRFALIGNGSFWMAAGVLRIAILAWIPVALKIEDPFLQTVVFASTTIGIVLGALLTPRIVNVEKFYKSVLYGFLMVAIVLLTPFIHFVAATVVCLLLIGFLGGVFIIPMNTVMQIEGQHTVGTGQTIAIQNFVENVLMIAGLVLFKLLLGSGVNITLCIVSMGLVLLLFVLYTYWEARIIKREMG